MAVLLFRIMPSQASTSVILEFSDGTTTNAEVGYLNSEELFINIDAYRTGRGTSIAKKSWRLRYNNDLNVWKVVAKI